ncbi:MAG: endonuclease-8 [Myxococcota bacterium]
MPEGDSLRNIARALTPLLEGQELVGLWTDGLRHPKLVGELLGAPSARGKHLLIPIGEHAVLHVHLGLNGAWHVYRPGERWRLPGSRAPLRLETAKHTLPCFDPMLVELLDAKSVNRHPMLARLGPDLLDEAPDLNDILDRARGCGRLSIAAVLLDQKVAAGIGNIYKNEVLFIAGRHPWTVPTHLSDDDILGLYALAAELLRSNVRAGMRATTPLSVQKRHRERFWVYGRAGAPCLRCGGRIQRRQQGDEGRDTMWCPRCQPAPPGASAPDWR